MSTDFWIQASCPQWLRLTRHDIISNSSAALLVETLAKYHGQVKPWAGVAIQPSRSQRESCSLRFRRELALRRK